jgi:integrase
VHYLKTEAAYRLIDQRPEAAEYLRKFVGDRRGFMFASQKGTTPMSYTNFLKRILTPDLEKHGLKEAGKAAHAFRRRSSVLSKSRVEDDLRKFWLGHENNDITAEYAEQDTRRQPLASGRSGKNRAGVQDSDVRSEGNCP